MTRLGRSALAVAIAAGAVLAGCGGDDGERDSADDATFCRLANAAEPVAEADAETMVRLEELAPEAIADQVAVLTDLAVQLDEAGGDTAEALALEFEVRFSDEYVSARVDVEEYLSDECQDEVTSVPTTSRRGAGTTTTSDPDGEGTGSTTTSTTGTSRSSTTAGDDGGDGDG